MVKCETMNCNQPHQIVIVGGGFGGLYAAQSLRGSDVEVTLIDRRNFHLFQPLLYQVATGGLSPADIASPLRAVLSRQRNVRVLQGEVTGFDVENRQVLLGEERIRYDKASSLGQTLAAVTAARLDRQGRLVVEPDLSLPDHPEILVLGDLAHFHHGVAEPLPGVAPVAMQQGRYAARLIKHRLQGHETRPFHYKDRGSMAVIGRSAAVAQIARFRFTGLFAWLTWLFVHLLYLVEYENRAIVLLQWGWNYVTRNRSARLITNVSSEARVDSREPEVVGL